jgi:hypothetical protein
MMLWLVVSSSNSLISVFSNWLDLKMKELTPLIKSYTRNSIDVINDLQKINLPKGTVIFSANPKSNQCTLTLIQKQASPQLQTF